MKFYRFGIVAVLFLILSLASVPAFAADSPSAAMLKITEIMHRLKHFPSPVGKSTLQALAEKSTTTRMEKILIEAMLNLQHKVTVADSKKLSALIHDGASNSNERSIATILLNLDHRPSKQDKAILKKILGK